MATKFTKPVVINAPEKDIVFDGCDFTEEALISVIAANSVAFRNCRFYGLIPNAAKTYGIKVDKAAEVKLVIENCFFGANPKVDSNKLYNLLELTGKLKDGSSISSNYFAADCCTHNQINVYAVTDGATIKLNKNEAVYSGNLVRIGIQGEPVCTIEMIGNKYHTTDPSEDGAWAGLVLIQPYGKVTTSFNNMTVQIKETVNLSDNDQVIYLYAGGSDTKFNKETSYPKVYIDGELMEDIPAYPGSVEEPAAVEAATV